MTGVGLGCSRDLAAGRVSIKGCKADAGCLTMGVLQSRSSESIIKGISLVYPVLLHGAATRLPARRSVSTVAREDLPERQGPTTCPKQTQMSQGQAGIGC